MDLNEAIESLHVKNYSQALEMFRDAAENHNADACDFIVQMYLMNLESSLTSKDYLTYAIKGYEYRSKDGCYNMGTLYRNGVLGTPDLSKAYEFFLEGANENQDARCQYYLAEMLKNGEVGKINVDEAVKYLGLSASQGYYPAQFMLAVIFEDVVENFQTTLDFYVSSSEKKHIDAMLRLAYIYEKGKRVPKDFAKSLSYYRMACENGSCEAKLKLSKIGLSPDSFGENTDIKIHQIRDWLKELSEDTSTKSIVRRDALYYLGQYYEQYEQESEEGISAAYDCFFESANMGSLPSLYKFACYLFEGIGCSSDPKKALSLLHFIKYVLFSNIDSSEKSIDIISSDRLLELVESKFEDFADSLSEEEIQDAFEMAEEKISKIFQVS